MRRPRLARCRAVSRRSDTERSSFRLDGDSRHEIAERESVIANNDLSVRNRDHSIEDRSSRDERVELPAFAARIYACRKLVEQAPVELSSGEISG